MDIKTFISDIEKRIIPGGCILFEEALRLSEAKSDRDLEHIYSAANRIRNHFRGNKVDLCAITNAKSGACGENCAFCSQSSHHNTDVDVYPFISVQEIVNRATKAVESRAHRFCIVTSGCKVSDKEMGLICESIRLIKQKFPHLKMDASLGSLTESQARLLKEAGLDRFNHNIETTESFFSKICTTHTFGDRLKTIRILKKVGIEVCCGGIFGLGENNKQRIEFALTLKDLDVDCVPLNFLNPVGGIPLEDNKIPEISELLKIIAIFRFILPKKQLRICGGREQNLGESQHLIFYAGADAIIIGDYLTTKGNAASKDLEMISSLGLEI